MAMAQADVHVKIDSKLKKECEEILDKIGLSTSDYVKMAFKSLQREEDIPFRTSVKNLPKCMDINTKEEAFINKAFEYNKKHPKTYTSEEILEELGIKS